MNLFPHATNILIKDIVQKIDHIALMKLLLATFDVAIDYFKKKELSYFDAQVGENLCQIRAYKIYLLNKCHLFHQELNKIQNHIQGSIKILAHQEQEYRYWLTRNKSDRPENIRTPLAMSEFFKELGVIITFQNNVLFVFLSYFLCKYCLTDDEKIPFTMDYQKIQDELSLSRSFSKRIVHYYQKHLSELSCNFIFELLNDFHEEEQGLHPVLKLLHRKGDEGRMVLPCFLVTKIIIEHMIKTEADMILFCNLKMGTQKRLAAFRFKGNHLIQNFDFTGPNQLDEKLNHLIFYGEHYQPQQGSINKFLSEIRAIGLKEVILYNNASHPQFSGQILLDFREDPFIQLLKEREIGEIKLNSKEILALTELSNRIIKYKHQASKLGCTRERPRLFLLKHIFCDKSKNYYDFLDKG